eukprot:scaffold650_cov249-Pinguiococcus_pyrenoidosus.AAC.5
MTGLPRRARKPHAPALHAGVTRHPPQNRETTETKTQNPEPRTRHAASQLTPCIPCPAYTGIRARRTEPAGLPAILSSPCGQSHALDAHLSSRTLPRAAD